MRPQVISQPQYHLPRTLSYVNSAYPLLQGICWQTMLSQAAFAACQVLHLGHHQLCCCHSATTEPKPCHSWHQQGGSCCNGQPLMFSISLNTAQLLMAAACPFAGDQMSDDVQWASHSGHASWTNHNCLLPDGLLLLLPWSLATEFRTSPRPCSHHVASFAPD